MILPNLITLARLLSAPMIVWLILETRYETAFWVFLAAGLSDGIDGFIAKQFGATSRLGAILDPIADKAVLIAVFVGLGRVGHIPSWLVILVVFRDLLIIGGALMLATLTSALKVAPLMISKLNTVAQIALGGLVLAALAFAADLSWIVEPLIYVVAATTAASGAGYVIAWGRRVGEIEDLK